MQCSRSGPPNNSTYLKVKVALRSTNLSASVSKTSSSLGRASTRFRWWLGGSFVTVIRRCYPEEWSAVLINLKL